MLIGITGGIGSGKSTICKALAAKGYLIYDCDSRAKDLIVRNRPVRGQIECLFGSEVFDGDTYRTDWVAKQVFKDHSLLERLNAIVHPAICRDVKRWHDAEMKRTNGMCVCFVESAILYESGLGAICDKVAYVDAPERVRIERAIGRDNSDIETVRKRIQRQNTSDAKQKSDIALLNDGTVPIANLVNCLERHVEALYAVR